MSPACLRCSEDGSGLELVFDKELAIIMQEALSIPSTGAVKSAAHHFLEVGPLVIRQVMSMVWGACVALTFVTCSVLYQLAAKSCKELLVEKPFIHSTFKKVVWTMASALRRNAHMTISARS